MNKDGESDFGIVADAHTAILEQIVELDMVPALTVTAHVQDSQNGNPIAGADVTYDSNRGSTDSLGLLNLGCYEEGDVIEIWVTYLGYFNFSQNYTVTSEPNQNVTIAMSGELGVCTA